MPGAERNTKVNQYLSRHNEGNEHKDTSRQTEVISKKKIILSKGDNTLRRR